MIGLRLAAGELESPKPHCVSKERSMERGGEVRRKAELRTARHATAMSRP